MTSDAGVGDKDIIRILSELRTLHEVPAMAAAFVTSQGLQKVAAVGTRKWGTDIPVTLEDKWHLGSDTKIITSTLIAILVAQGKLAWTSTVAEVFCDIAADFHADFKNVTILHLLSHRAGLPENLDYDTLDSKASVRNQRIEAVIEGLRNKPLSAPGSHFLYSNLGYIIVGAMAERVTGIDWETAVTQYIFSPLEMNSAGFGGIGTPGQIDQPWGHEVRNTPYIINGPEADNPPAVGPAGRVHCTIQDWARFICDQLRGARGEPGLLGVDSYRMLQQPHFGGEYALGWRAVDINWAGGKALAHAGSNTMYLSIACVVPARDYAILVCTNEGPDSYKAADGVIRKIAKDIAHIETQGG